MATVDQQRKPGDEDKGASGAGWRHLNGAPAYVDEEGEIVAACPGLEGYNIDELDETRDEREAKMEAAEASGYEPDRVKDARQEHAQMDAARHACQRWRRPAALQVNSDQGNVIPVREFCTRRGYTVAKQPTPSGGHR